MNTEIEEFLRLVSKMRNAQKDYFKHRTNGRLVTAKELEQKVDKELNELLTPIQKEEPIIVQTDIFKPE